MELTGRKYHLIGENCNCLTDCIKNSYAYDRGLRNIKSDCRSGIERIGIILLKVICSRNIGNFSSREYKVTITAIREDQSTVSDKCLSPAAGIIVRGPGADCSEMPCCCVASSGEKCSMYRSDVNRTSKEPAGGRGGNS